MNRTKVMATLTNERLEEISSGKGCVPLTVEAQQLADENLSLRTKLAELKKQKPVAWTNADNLFDVSIGHAAHIAPRDENTYRMPLYAHPVPLPVTRIVSAGWQAYRDDHWFSIKAEDVPHYLDNEKVPVCEIFSMQTEPYAVSMLEDDVLAVVGLLEEHEWAEFCTKTELGRRLEQAITKLQAVIAGGDACSSAR
ncbi:hypothetical protein OHK33_22145 [Pectobacterium aroidearum]|uniref:hypothetical protein n=1 Tax=Pectobacterium aroidearum TaxID=1201031 RepID=UPI0033075909